MSREFRGRQPEASSGGAPKKGGSGYMDDPKRFLRYLTPGVFFCLELALLFLITDHTHLDGIVQYVSTGPGGLGLSLFALGASAGIGYVLSIAHHGLFWQFPKLYEGDHSGFVQAAARDKLLILWWRDEEKQTIVPADAADVSRKGAWRIVCALWHGSLAEKNSGTGPVNTRMNSLTDLAHGAGATFLGSVAALGVFACVKASLMHCEQDWNWLYLTAVGAGILASVFLLRNARLTMEHAFGLAEMVLRRQLEAYKKEKKEAPSLVLRQAELEGNASGKAYPVENGGEEGRNLRVQLAELNSRSRWYSSQMWQVPFAYLGVSGLVLTQVPWQNRPVLKIGLIVAGVLGLLVFWHMLSLRRLIREVTRKVGLAEKKLNTPDEICCEPSSPWYQSCRLPLLLLLAIVSILALVGGIFLRVRKPHAAQRQPASGYSGSSEDTH